MHACQGIVENVNWSTVWQHANLTAGYICNAVLFGLIEREVIFVP